MGFNQSIYSCWGVQHHLMDCLLKASRPSDPLGQILTAVWFWNYNSLVLRNHKGTWYEINFLSKNLLTTGTENFAQTFTAHAKEKEWGEELKPRENFLLFLIGFWSSNIWSSLPIIREITQAFCIGDMNCNYKT